MTKAIIDIFQNLLRPDEVGDAIEEVYATLRDGLTAYEASRAEIPNNPKHKRK
jgi:hypothetical protein